MSTRNRWGFYYDRKIHGDLTPYPADTRVARRIVNGWKSTGVDLESALRIAETDEHRTLADVRVHVAIRNILDEERAA